MWIRQFSLFSSRACSDYSATATNPSQDAQLGCYRRPTRSRAELGGVSDGMAAVRVGSTEQAVVFQCAWSRIMHCYQGRFTALLALLGATLSASAVRAQVPIRVTVENIAPTNSVATSPVRFGLGAGGRAWRRVWRFREGGGSDAGIIVSGRFFLSFDKAHYG